MNARRKLDLPRSVSVGGFTLLELLVVMALLSLLMTAMGAALHSVAQSASRIDERTDRMDEHRVAVGIIRATIGRVSARRMADPATPGGENFFFTALPDEVSWIGVMPARHSVAGRMFFRLKMEEVGAMSALVLRFAPWNGVPPPDWSAAESHVIANEVSSLELRYENARENPPAWTDTWSKKDFLPARVSLTLHAKVGQQIELIVPMRVLPASGRSQAGGDGTVVGGTPL